MTTTHSPVAIPDSTPAREAAELIRSVESDLLCHHSPRGYAFGALQGARQGLTHQRQSFCALIRASQCGN